jgi:hypothetical protein
MLRRGTMVLSMKFKIQDSRFGKIQDSRFKIQDQDPNATDQV